MPGWDGKSRMELCFALRHFGREFLERLVGGGWRNFSAESASSRKELPWWVTLRLARRLWDRGKLPALPSPSHPARAQEVLAVMAKREYETAWRQVSAIYMSRKKEAKPWRLLKLFLAEAAPDEAPEDANAKQKSVHPVPGERQSASPDSEEKP